MEKAKQKLFEILRNWLLKNGILLQDLEIFVKAKFDNSLGKSASFACRLLYVMKKTYSWS